MLKIIAPLALALTFLLSGCEFDSAPATPAPAPGLVIFEDGSGVDDTGRTYPEDTFDWDCATMGNKVCAPALTPDAPMDGGRLPMDVVVYEDGSALQWDGSRSPAGSYDYSAVPSASRYSPCP